MNVQVNNLALVFGPEHVCGKVVRVLWPHDICEPFGYRWVVWLEWKGEFIVPDSSLMALDIAPLSDPGARELLDADGQRAWDKWFSPPDINF